MSTTSSARRALRIEHLSKRFGSTFALRDVDFELAPGEIRGLVGRNGAGKSTLVKILSGYHQPDEGATIEVDGAPLELPLTAAGVRAARLSFVHQDLALIPEATVLENVRAGRFETGRGWRIRWSPERARVRAALDRLGVSASLDDRVASLGELDRALVAIARGFLDLEGDTAGGILVLDEPTAFMPREQASQLFDAVRSVAAAGTAVVFVSHRIEEVLAVSDNVSVLRDGALVTTVPATGTSAEQLIELILGDQIGSLYPQPRHVRSSAVVLDVAGLLGTTVRDCSFTLRRGEIVGLTGVRGAGHEELLYLIFGARRAAAGVLSVGEAAGQPAARMSPRRAIGSGIMFLPADRPRFGGVAEFDVRANVSLPIIDRFYRRGRLDRRAESASATALIAAHAVKPADVTAAFGSLSGGNQQRALFAKWLQIDPTVYLLHEPTAGVDAHAKQHIFRQLEEIAERDGAIAVASEEWEDLAHICDRVLVFRNGRVTAELTRGADLSESSIFAAS